MFETIKETNNEIKKEEINSNTDKKIDIKKVEENLKLPQKPDSKIF